MCWLIIGEHALLVEAFVMRRPDENRSGSTISCCNAIPNVRSCFSVDSSGDVYLSDGFSLHALAEE